MQVQLSDVAKYNKMFGTLSDPRMIPTGSIVFDSVLGGGIPSGHFIELASTHGLGKSTACLHFCRTICATGGTVLYLDYEKGTNIYQLKSMGLMEYYNKNFFIVTPTTFEDGENILAELLPKGLSLVVIDSITSMISEKAIDGSITDINIGLQSRLQGIFLPKIRYWARKYDCPFIFINQLRTKINMSGPSVQESSGGLAVKFYMDVRLQMAQEEFLKRKEATADTSKEVNYGVHAKLWSIKNRFVRPYIEKVVTIMFGKGISDVSAYLRFLMKNPDLIARDGAYYTVRWPGMEPFKLHGSDKLTNWVRENIQMVKDYVESCGGIRLVNPDAEPDESSMEAAQVEAATESAALEAENDIDKAKKRKKK